MLRNGLRKLRESEDGLVLVLFAWTLPVLLGIAALAIDVSYSLSLRNDAQRAADNAAMSTSRAALASSSFASEGDGLKFSIKEAYAVAEMNGYKTDPANNTLVTVHSVAAPDAFELSTSRYKTIAGSIEVNITQPQSLFFGTLFQEFDTTVSPPQPIFKTMKVRAVGQGTSACILVLNKRRNSDIDVQSGAINTNCGFIVNSNFTTSGAQAAVTISGSGSITVGSLTVRNPGQVAYGSGGAVVDVCNPVASGKFISCPYFTTNEAALNPYADLNSVYVASRPSTASYITMSAPIASGGATMCRTGAVGGKNNYTVSSGSVGSPTPAGCEKRDGGTLNTGTSENITINATPSPVPTTNQNLYASNLLTTSGSGTYTLTYTTIQSAGSTTIAAGSTLIVGSNSTLVSDNTLTVAKASSSFGTLNVTNGGTVYIKKGATIDGSLIISRGGTVVVDNAGTASLTVNGTVNVATGGRLIMRSGNIVLNPDSQLVINGSAAADVPTKFIMLTTDTANPSQLQIKNGSIFRTTNLNQSRADPDEFLIQGGSAAALLQIDNAGVMMLGSGLYYVDGGIIGGSSSFLTSTLPLTSANLPITTGPSTASTTIATSTFGKFDFNSGTTIKLRSPKSGVWQNVAIYQTEPPASTDPYAGAPNNTSGDNTANFPPWNPPVANTVTSNFQSAAAQMSIDGAVVLPWTDVVYRATNVDPTVCTFFIVNRFAFAGGSTLGSGCSSSSAISGVGQGFLVE